MLSHYGATPERPIANNDIDSMFNGHGSAHNGSNGPIEETRLEKRTTPCTLFDIEAEKVTAVEEVTEHGAVHSSTAAAVEKEGVKTVEKIGTQADVFLSLFYVF